MSSLVSQGLAKRADEVLHQPEVGPVKAPTAGAVVKGSSTRQGGGGAARPTTQPSVEKSVHFITEPRADVPSLSARGVRIEEGQSGLSQEKQQGLLTTRRQ